MVSKTEKWIFVVVVTMVVLSIADLIEFMIGNVDNAKPNTFMKDTQDLSLKNETMNKDVLLQQGMYAGMTEPSFEMRENVDFLLTPGILVQECMSDDVILTYPEE